MSRFIRLTNIIINTKHIESIEIKYNHYKINYSAYINDCNLLPGCSSYYGMNTSIYKNKQPLDYNILTNYINKNFPIENEKQQHHYSKQIHNINYKKNTNSNWKPEI